jgi:hypothetical protein
MCGLQLKHWLTPLAAYNMSTLVCACHANHLPAGDPGRPSSDSCASDAAAHCQATAQLSEELWQQLSGFVGRAFSHTEEGFEVMVPASTTAAAESALAADPAIVGDLLLPAAALIVPGSPATEEEEEEEESLFWGSPVKHESAAAAAAAAAANAYAADSQEQHQEESLAPIKAEDTDAAEAAPARRAPSFGKISSALESSPDQSCENLAAVVEAATAAAAAPGIPPAGTPAASFTSFREISRMISTSESPACTSHSSSRRASKTGQGVPNLAARLLDEGGAAWGTPREGSSWGTPREHRLSTEAAACGQHEAAEEAVVARLAARSSRCSSDAGSASHLSLQAKLEAAAEQQLLRQQQQQDSEADSSAELSGSIRQAVLASEPATGAPPSYDQLDFTIAAAVDVQQPVASVRNSRRSSRELYRVRRCM